MSTPLNPGDRFAEAHPTRVGPSAVPDVALAAHDPALYVMITYVHVDPRGPDVRAEGGEFVQLTNVGPTVADVSGWSLRDRAGHVLALPGQTYIGPSQALHLHVGRGTNTAKRVFAGRRGAILNNRGGDRLELIDAHGRVVHVVSWGPER